MCLDAHALISPNLPEERKRDVAERLASSLVWKAGVPVVVGSGRASIRRKVHAVAHSERLKCKSWPDAVELPNAIVSWTGDLGTESGFWQFRSRLDQLFGDWVVRKDVGVEPQ